MVTAFSYPTPPEVGLVTFRSRIASYILFLFFLKEKKEEEDRSGLDCNK